MFDPGIACISFLPPGKINLSPMGFAMMRVKEEADL
jgi:hypothetical protein